MMQLRRLLSPAGEPEADRLITSNSGYLLRVEPDDFDLHRFDTACEEGLKAAAKGDFSTADAALDRALALWRGTPAEDVVLGPTLRTLVTQLSERYVETVENHMDVQLALGGHIAVARRLRTLIDQYPLRERIHEQLMLAMYRCGDVADALKIFARARQNLADELGVDPGTGLSRLHQAILRRDVDVLRPGPSSHSGLPISSGTSVEVVRATAPSVIGEPPRELPCGPSIFVGRKAQMDSVYEALEGDDGPRVVAIHGPGGTGKSALALRTAHTVADGYPGGQLYLDLQGSTPGLPPLRPSEVISRTLRSLGVPHAEIPVAWAEAASRYQTLLAERRVLIVLDNAADITQITPLVPARGSSALIVTSRTVQTTLDAVQIAVGVLDDADALHLLELSIGRPRVDTERQAALDIARLCCHQPLALRIVGARLAARPDWSLSRFRGRLSDQRRRLDELRVADQDIRSCFAVSYGSLPSAARPGEGDAARLFQLLGAFGVPEFGTELAAALLSADAVPAETALDELVESRLIEPVTEDRFRMHDLLRAYATERAAELPAESRSAAVRRALSWYLDVCRDIVALLQRGASNGVEPESATGSGRPWTAQDGLRWLDKEFPCLVAAAIQAADAPPETARHVTELLTVISSPAMKRGYWRELETLTQLALQVTRRLGDRAEEATTLMVSSVIDWRADRPEAARDSLVRSRSLAQELGDPETEARALHSLGWLSLRRGDPTDALDHITTARRLLDEHGRGHTAVAERLRHNQGEALLQLGRYAEAAHCFQQRLSAERDRNGRLSESITMAALGRAYCLLGQYDQALTMFEETLRRCQEVGNREDAWEALLCRSEIRLHQGRPAVALTDLTRARELVAETGDDYGRAAVMRQLARAHEDAGDLTASADAARTAEKLFASPTLRLDPILEAFLTADSRR
ncbi:BTAD domain-containing putative transcriptional regulator [Streptomyces sp. NPDC020766]|uniref:AfsR/SARP family transcriptional regulator n=1 Tax=Streptomyces sp. NPDC020766 TaxID=3155011 RepID=UPI0033FE82BC